MYPCRTGKKQRRKLASCQTLKCSAEAAFPGSGTTRGLSVPLRTARGRVEMRVCISLCARRCSQFRDGGTEYPGEGFPASLSSLSPAACGKLLLCLPVWGTGAVTSVDDFSPPSILPLFTALLFLNEAGGGRRAELGVRREPGWALRTCACKEMTPFPFPELLNGLQQAVEKELPNLNLSPPLRRNPGRRGCACRRENRDRT